MATCRRDRPSRRRTCSATLGRQSRWAAAKAAGHRQRGAGIAYRPASSGQGRIAARRYAWVGRCATARPERCDPRPRLLGARARKLGEPHRSRRHRARLFLAPRQRALRRAARRESMARHGVVGSVNWSVAVSDRRARSVQRGSLHPLPGNTVKSVHESGCGAADDILVEPTASQLALSRRLGDMLLVSQWQGRSVLVTEIDERRVPRPRSRSMIPPAAEVGDRWGVGRRAALAR